MDWLPLLLPKQKSKPFTPLSKCSKILYRVSEQEHKNDFISFDLNQDGNVDAQEVRSVYPEISQEDLSAFFIATDKNENGLIDFDEYMHASLQYVDGSLNLEDFNIY